MISWIVAAYLAIALLGFAALARTLEPLDVRAWLAVLFMAIFWSATLFWLAIP